MSNHLPPQAYGELAEGVSQILFSAAEIEAQVLEMGQAISRDYAGSQPILVGVLKGVFPFMADLIRAITIPVEVDFMAIANYSSDTRDQGFVRLQKDLNTPIEGRHVLFVEDVIDTGLTLNYLLRLLNARGPSSLEVCSLFCKPERRLANIAVRYRGFNLPDKFVVGYGLDYRELYRNLPYVGLLKPDLLQSE
jgi:hypoxanthine phosphoribosyltransferase